MKKFNSLIVIFLTTAFSGVFAGVPMLGTYNVGTGQTYPTLSAAFADMNTSGISAPITLIITSDITESAAISLSVPANSSLITIKPASGVTPTVTLVATGGTGTTLHNGLTIVETSNVTIDGSNTAGGTTKDLTFKLNDLTNGLSVIDFYGNCDNVTIKNIVSVFQVMPAVSATSALKFEPSSTNVCDNLVIDNCNFGDATNTPFNCLSINGLSGIFTSNIKVINSLIYGQSRPLDLAYIGQLGGEIVISGNIIHAIGGADQVVTYSVYLSYYEGTINILNNKFPTLTVANAYGTNSVYGLYIAYGNTGITANIINNFFGGNCASTGVAKPANFTQIFASSSNADGVYNICHNTFDIKSGLTNATKLENIYLNRSTATYNVYNNIFINNTVATYSYCIYRADGILNSDYNIFYGNAANLNSQMGSARTFTAWQAEPYDVHSVVNNVSFTDALTGDLTLTSPSTTDANLKVPRLTYVLKDYFGIDRLNPTFAGAQEVLLPTFLKNGLDNDIKIINNFTGIEVLLKNESVVELFTINGLLIDKTKTIGKYSHNLNKGIYLIRINGSTTKFIK